MGSLMIIVVSLLVMTALFQCTNAATTHIVGGNLGWVVPPNNATYSDWACNQTIAVGDILVFNFVSREHDVLQVPKESYDSCSDDNAIASLISTGPANITISSSGDHHYICTVGRHCSFGQKLAVNVVSTSATTPLPSAMPPTAGTPSPPSSVAALSITAGFWVVPVLSAIAFLL